MYCIKISLKNINKIMEAFEKYKTVRRFCWGVLMTVFLSVVFSRLPELLSAIALFGK